MRDEKLARIARHYKYAFDPDFNKNQADGRHLKTGLSEKQKNWIKTAWITVHGAWRCIFPVYRGDKPMECGVEYKVEAHHQYPQGATKRQNEDPDVPRNVVPLCDKHHRKGQRDRELTREEQDVVHLDSAYGNRHYTEDKEVYHKIAQQRSEHLDKGEEYWVPFWDSWFKKKANETVDIYTAMPETPPYPDNANQRRHYDKVWDFQKKEWVDV